MSKRASDLVFALIVIAALILGFAAGLNVGLGIRVEQVISTRPAIGSIVEFDPSPLESGVQVTTGRVHRIENGWVHIRPILNGVEQAEFWKLTPREIRVCKENE